MTRTHGRALRGQRLVASVPHARWTTMTFVAALRSDGLVAPCVFDGAINGCLFLAWVTQFLVPTLRHGDIVVLDNLGSHKGVADERSVAAVWHRIGALLQQFSPAECANYLRHAGYDQN
jgi:hypothetical protein